MEAAMSEQRENPATPDPEPRKCRAFKGGRIDLHCTEPEGHDRPAGGLATWHKAVYRSRQEVDYDGAHHVVETVETVTWEPVDRAAEATRHLLADLRRDQ
jgi:hypothetical protein